MRKKLLLSTILSVVACTVISMVGAIGINAAEASAQSTASVTDKTIMWGTSGIQDPTKTTYADNAGYYSISPNSYIYFGMNGNTPIVWRVLDADKTNDSTTAGIFMLSEYLFDGNVAFNKGNTGNTGNVYQGSEAQDWCIDFANEQNNFNSAEQSVMLGITKEDTAGSLQGINYGASSLTSTDKVFFISVKELQAYVGNRSGYFDANTADGAAQAWWLRSPSSAASNVAVIINSEGEIKGFNVKDTYYARPAVNIDRNSVLFSTAASMGRAPQSLEPEGGTWSLVSDYSGNEWRLVLLDDTRTISVNETAVFAEKSGTVYIDYTVTGVNQTNNEFVSAIIEDKSGNPLYYVNLARSSAMGTAVLTLPSDMAAGNYKIKMFSEQLNGEKTSGLASNFATVELTVAENGHSHSYYYNATEDKITEGCSCGHYAYAQLVAPKGALVYDGATAFDATVSYGGDAWQGGVPALSYTNKLTAVANTKEAGRYIATLTYTALNYDYTVSVDYTVEKAVRNVPDGVLGIATSFYDTTDGKITGVSPEMEYSADGTTWLPISGTEITGLISGTYMVRYPATDNYYASSAVLIGVGKGGDYIPSLEFANDFDLNKTYDNIAVSIDTSDYTYVGDGQVTVIWYKDNGGEKGDVLSAPPTNAGAYWIGISASGGDKYSAVSEITRKIVISPKDISGAEITLDGELTYNGKSQEQKVASVVVDGLKATFDVSGNVQTNVGTADYMLTVTGNGNFTGTATKSWNIAKASQAVPVGVVGVMTSYIDTNDGKITGVTPEMEYKLSTAESWTAVVGTEIVDLASGIYYVRYAETNNCNVSEYITVKINNGGKLIPAFEITGDLNKTYDNTAVSVSTSDYIYNGDGQVTVIWYKDNGGEKGEVLSAPPTNAGTYWIGISASEGALYNSTMEVAKAFVIEKAPISKPQGDTRVFIYNGREQCYTVADSSLYTVSGASRTNAGSQAVTVALVDTDNYEWDDHTAASLVFTFTIEKANAEITVDTTDIVKTYGDKWELPSASADYGTVVCDKTVEALVNAGTYTVTYTVAGTENYNGDTKTVNVKINKATFDMTSVTFTDKTVKYNGESHSIVLDGALPTGVEVTYANNGNTDVGVYEITASFSYDEVNYNAISPMVAVLTINRAELSGKIEDEAEDAVVTITSENGFSHNAELIVAEMTIDSTDISGALLKNETAVTGYSFKMMANGVAIQPNGGISVKLLIPDELRGKEFRIISNNNREYGEVTHTVEDGYAIFSTDKLNEIIFAVEETPSVVASEENAFPWWIIVIIAAPICVVGATFGIVFGRKKLTKSKTEE